VSVLSSSAVKEARDVMGQSGQPLSDRPETIEPQGLHGQAAERGQDPNSIGLAVAVRVFLELGVAGQCQEFSILQRSFT